MWHGHWMCMWHGHWMEAVCASCYPLCPNRLDVMPNLARLIQIDPWLGDWSPNCGNQWSSPQSSSKQILKCPDSCFGLVGPHQCGILMVIAGWPAVSVSTPSRTLVVSTEAGSEYQSQVTVCSMTDKPLPASVETKVFYLGWIQKQPVIQQLPSVCQTDEAQYGKNSCLWLWGLLLVTLCQVWLGGRLTISSSSHANKFTSSAVLNLLSSLLARAT